MKKLIIFVASLLLIVSCTSPSEEVGAPFYKGQEVVLSAMIADAAAPTGPQRISGKDHDPSNIDGSVITLTWDEGDRVLVKVGDASASFRLLDGAGTNSATIRGEMPAEGSSYDVFYPVTYNESVLDEQNYVENGFEKGLVKMSTKTPGTLGGGFTMSADNALLGLQLTGEDELGKIVLTNSATSKTYTLNCAGVTLTDAAKLFYIVVPAGEWTSGFSVEIYGSDASTKLATFEKTSSASFVAGKAMIMPLKALTQAVDLGLSVKWATMNVGASAPEEYGDYFAWGETKPKEGQYIWATYKFGTQNALTKYNNTSDCGTVDNKTTLELEDDAAHVNWGGSWRMPTLAEMEELFDEEKCTWEKTTLNGVNGFKVTGPNGNSIFLPSAGQRLYILMRPGELGGYWSSSLRTDGPNDAWRANFFTTSSDLHYMEEESERNYGRSVRPVCPK